MNKNGSIDSSSINLKLLEQLLKVLKFHELNKINNSTGS